MSRLVDACAERLGVVIEYQPKTLTETVTLRGAVSDAELWDLTNRLLAARGFTTIRVGDSPALSVVRLQDAVGTARIESSLDATDPVPAGYMRVLVPVTNRDAASVLEAIRPLLSKPGGEAVAVGRERTILVSDLRPRVVEILAFVAALDAAPPEVSVTRIELGHLDGQPMATLAMQVALKREAASGVKTPGEVIAAGDARAVLIVAPRSSTEFWRALIESLDVAEAQDTRTYTPRHFGVAEVASLLGQTLAGLAPPPRVVVDSLTGSLIVTATPAAHERVSAMLERLDATPPGERRPMRSYAIRNRGVEEILRVVGTLIEAGALESGADEGSIDATAGADRPADAGALRALGTPALTLTADASTSRLIA
ncbi:MAG: hypothetical protein H6811_10060 [Phycisphaeraceae bacterium]|nr:hypothetical protein [Phycisphaeraceae bacterium]